VIRPLKEALEAMGGRGLRLKRELGSAAGRKRTELIQYVWTYYTSESDGWGGWGHHPEPITMSEIVWAVNRLHHQAGALPSTTVGRLVATDPTCSILREMAKDLVLYRRGIEPSTLEWFDMLTQAKCLYGRPESNPVIPTL
jgi:hypothetical protein